MIHPQDGMPSFIIQAAERILADAFGARVRLSQREDLGGSRRTKVCRCAMIEGPVEGPASMVVKAASPSERESYDPDNPESGAWTLFNDWAGLAFFQAIGVPLAPWLYGGDRATGVLVIEDLGTVERLDQRLLAEDAEAAQSALFAYARALGQMHSRTVGRRGE